MMQIRYVFAFLPANTHVDRTKASFLFYRFIKLNYRPFDWIVPGIQCKML